MKKILLLVLIVCVGFATSSRAAVFQDASRAATYYRDGARFALEGRLAEAANAFEQAVALDPSNGNAFYGLGNVYAELGRWADASNAYYKAVSLNKSDVEAYNNLGVALSRRGLHVQAAAAFERAIKIYPKWAEPYYHLSESRRALHQEPEARAAYEEAIRLRPDYAARPPQPFTTTTAITTTAAKSPAPPRGQILEAMKAVNLGGTERVAASSPAASDSSAASDAAPNSVASNGNATPTTNTPAASKPARTAPTNAARPAPTNDKQPVPTNNTRPAPTNSTKPTTTNATRPAPTNDTRTVTTGAAASSPYDVGVSAARAGRYEEAVAAFRQAIILDRSSAAAYRALGDAYASMGNWRESVDAYEQAARLDPNDAETYQRLGRSYAKLRETTPATGTRDGATKTTTTAAGTEAPSSIKTSVERPSAEATSGERLPTYDDPDPTALYRVGPGDVLDIRVLKGREHRTTTYEVTPTGLLDYPALLEPLAVAGLTTEQVAERIGASLKLRASGPSPEIAVGVREYVSHAVIVGGMVKEGGTKILQREGVPLYVIIAYAQPTPGAGEAVVVSRATGRTTTVDLLDAAAMKALVRPGDVVTVRALPRQFVYVAGAVRQPGQKEFHSGMTLTQALLAAGGTLAPGANAVSITRQEDDGRLSTMRHGLLEIKTGKVPDPILRPGDRVEVPR
jgi:protein involved in polysaccharide export with SLBB domain/Tfp pilus assembly protein PilF